MLELPSHQDVGAVLTSIICEALNKPRGHQGEGNCPHRHCNDLCVRVDIWLVPRASRKILPRLHITGHCQHQMSCGQPGSGCLAERCLLLHKRLDTRPPDSMPNPASRQL